MKKRKALFLSVFLYSITYFGVASAAQPQTITLAADEWCPYNCVPGSEKPGYFVEIAPEVFSKAGYKVDYQVIPWARAIQMVRVGKIDGIIAAFPEDAPDFIYPDNPVGEASNAFFVRSESKWKYDGLHSLEAVLLGVIRGYAYSKEVDAYVEAHEGDETHLRIASGETALEQNLQTLLKGRLDVVIEDKNVMNSTLAGTSMRSQIKEVGTLAGEKAYIAFSPVNPHSAEYARILSEGVAQLKSSGRYRAILAKYGVEDPR